jgi:hypothetical protein
MAFLYAFASKKSASGSGPAAATVDPSNLLDQLQSDSPAHNLALATQARQRMAIALQTHRSIDAQMESKRISLLGSYLPFLRTILAQHLELDDDARTKNEKTAEVEWCTILLTGARPTKDDKVPYFNYHKLDLQQELAHALFVSQAARTPDTSASGVRASAHSLPSYCVCYLDSRHLSLSTRRFAFLPRDAVSEHHSTDLVQGPAAWMHFERPSRVHFGTATAQVQSTLVRARGVGLCTSSEVF